MTNPVSRFLNRLAPFVGFGVAIAVFIGLILLMSYFLIWGLFIGLVLYAGAAIRQKFFPPETPPTPTKEQPTGRLFVRGDDRPPRRALALRPLL